MNDAGREMGSGEIGFFGLLRLFWFRRVLILGVAGATTVIFVAAAFLMTPIYRSTTILVPSGDQRSSMGAIGDALGQLGGLAALAGVNVSSGSESDEAMAVLKSRQFTDKFIAENGLAEKFFSEKWDQYAKEWRVEAQEQPTPAQAYAYFDERVRTVSRDVKTGMVTLKIDWRDRTEGADWANELVRRINIEMRERAIEKANASLAYLQAELQRTSEIGTREAISRLIEAQIRQRMLANVTEEYAFRVVDKAMVADKDQVVRPRKLVLLLLGVFAGLFLGAAGAIVASAVSGYRNSLR